LAQEEGPEEVLFALAASLEMQEMLPPY